MRVFKQSGLLLWVHAEHNFLESSFYAFSCAAIAKQENKQIVYAEIRITSGRTNSVDYSRIFRISVDRLQL
ncbi:hypothetical protein D3C78_677400 [compost metagenome]